MNSWPLPDGWRVARMGSLAARRQHALVIGPFGSDLKTSDYVESGVPIIFVRDVQANHFLAKKVQYISEQKARDLAPHIAHPGDVVITKMGTPPCIAAVYPASRPPGVVTADIIKLTADETIVNSKFLAYFLNAGIAREQVAKITFGITRPKVTLRDFKELQVPLPPLADQLRIAGVLDQAEALRAKRRAALAQLDTLAQAIFFEMFGDHATVSRWPTQKLGSLLDFLTSGSRGWATYYSNSGALFLRVQNVLNDELDLEDIAYVNAPATAEARRTLVQAGDVLLSITADLGRTAVVPEGIGPAHINQHLAILRAKSLEPRFLSAFLASPAGKNQILGRNRHGVKAGINFDDIRSFLVPLPPSEVQREFVGRLVAVDKLKATNRASLSELDALFASLQHRAFRGEL